MNTISEALKSLREDVEELSAEEAANEILKTTKYKESAKGNLAGLIAFWENESDVMPADAIEDYKEADSKLSKKYGEQLVSWVDTYEKGDDDPGDGSWHLTVHLKNGKVKKLIGDYQGFLGIAELEEARSKENKVQWFKDNRNWWDRHTVEVEGESYDVAWRALFGYLYDEKVYCSIDPDNDEDFTRYATFEDFAEALREMFDGRDDFSYDEIQEEFECSEHLGNIRYWLEDYRKDID